MDKVKVNLPADSQITDITIRQEVSQLKEMIRTLVTAVNELIDKVEGKPDGS